MGHLGAPRVVQLALERFYWPNMEYDITDFVTKVCPCLNRDSQICLQVLHYTVWLPPIPLNYCLLTFYIWSQVLVVMNTSKSSLTILLILHKHIQQRISQLQLRLIACLITFYYGCFTSKDPSWSRTRVWEQTPLQIGKAHWRKKSWNHAITPPREREGRNV